MEAGQGDFTEEEVLVEAASVAVAAVSAAGGSAVAVGVALAAAEVQEAGRMKRNNDSLGPGQ